MIQYLKDLKWKQACILVTIGFLANWLSGCQAITKYKCNNKDWAKIGLHDGQAGKIPEKGFAEHDQVCSQAGAQIDKAGYMAGHKSGLGEFCVYDTGVQQAVDGMENNGLCLADFGEKFDEGFKHGLSELCTSVGGNRLGSRALRYHGTCPEVAQEKFLIGYLGGLDSYIPIAESRLSSLKNQLTVIDTSLTTLQAQIASYDSALAQAKKSNNDEIVDNLSAGISPLRHKQLGLSQDQHSINSQITMLSTKLATATRMRHKWSNEILESTNE